MKPRWLIVIAIVVSAAIAFSVMSRARPLADTVQRLFGYQLKDTPQIITRKAKIPLAIHGPGYEENTTLRLSAADYHDLTTKLLSDPSFEKKKMLKGEGFFYDRFIVGQQLLSWSCDGSKREFSYSYYEYSPNQTLQSTAGRRDDQP